VSIYLLDVNVLIALHTPAHGSYQKVQGWFQSVGRSGFSTCPITQSGFLRVSAQISAEANVGYREAKIALEQLTSLPGHVFWPMTIGYLQASALLESRIQGHRQVTDAYLLGISLSVGGALATLDRGVLHLAGPEFAGVVELIA
jgi:toxin-antitoxin system PIN domain toxin